jgi:heme exporter protein B
LIFGTGAVEAVNTGITIIPNVALMGAMFLAALVFTPWVTAQALRISME